VLDAAALTYVAAAGMAALQLLRLRDAEEQPGLIDVRLGMGRGAPAQSSPRGAQSVEG
jgi:Zn-dependent membrane protease YugP